MTPDRMGPYRIERLLGRGGMGSVYAAVDEKSGEAAAVKIMSVAFADDESFRERFAAEIETLKKLKHPNIVQLHGFGVERGLLFYAMELVRGRNLQEELHDGRRFDWREVSRIGVEVCQALKHAHDRGVIHRDLKPANLLFDERERIKLSDFGIAKLFGAAQLTAEHGVLGTVDYMSPEQAEGHAVTSRSDLYCLGGVLYALLAGRPPFVAKSAAKVIHSLRFDDPLPVRRFAPDAPKEFERIIAQLLDKDPPRRIATALALSNRLKAMEFALSVRPRPGDPQPPSDDPLSTKETLDEPRPPDSGAGATAVATAADPIPPADIPTQADPGSHVVDSAFPVDPSRAGEPDTPAAAHAKQSADAAIGESHFTTVDEDERRRAEQLRRAEKEGPGGWLTLVGAVLGLGAIAAAVWFFTRPPSADELYARIAEAAEEEEAEALLDVDEEIQRFLDLFPQDKRSRDVAQYQETIHFYRLQRRFERRSRRRGDADELTPIVTLFLEAIRAEQFSPEASAAKLEALIAVYGGGPNTTEGAVRQCLELARHRLQELEKSIACTSAIHLTVINQQLERAEQLLETEPASAHAILRGIIELYADKPWAAEAVERSRAALQTP